MTAVSYVIWGMSVNWVQHVQNVMDQHTTPAKLGRVFDIAGPRLGVGMHFPLDDDLLTCLNL